MIFTNTSRASFMNTLHNYHPTSEVIQHPVLGAFSVIQNPQGHKLLKKHLPIEQAPNLDLTKYDRYLTIEYPRILEFKAIVSDTTTSGYSIFSEYFNGTLREEIEQRFLAKTPYSELEVLSILQNISSSLSFLQSIKIYHGGIKSTSIVNCSGDYKVLNPALFKASTQEHTEFKPNLPNAKTRIITPEIRNAFHRQVLDSVHENYKDDVYGLGLIALDLMTLQVDPSISIEKRLERSSFSYSGTLVKFVKKMLENVLTLRLDPVSCNSYIEQIHLQHGLVSFKRYSRLDQSCIPSYRSRFSEFPDIRDQERSLPPLKTPNLQTNRERATESVTPTYRTRPTLSSVTIDLSPIQHTQHTSPPQTNENNNQERVHIQSLKDESLNTSSLRQSEPFMRIRETIVYKKMEERPLDDLSSMGKSSVSTQMTYTQRNSKTESFIGSNWSIFGTPRVSVAIRNPNLQNQTKSGIIIDKSPLFESKWTPQENKKIEPQQQSEIFIRSQHIEETDKENNNTSNLQSPTFDLQSPELPKQAHTIRVTTQTPLDVDLKKLDNHRVQISTRICPRLFDKEATTPKSTHVIQEVSSDLASVGLKEAVSFYVDESTTPIKDQSIDEILSSSNLLNKNGCFDNKENIQHSVPTTFIQPSFSFESQKYQTFKPRPVETITVKTFYAAPQDSATSFIRNSFSQISLRTSSVSNMKSQSNMIKTVTETLNDGSVYEGEMFGYMKQGRGKLTYPDGKYYEGEWRIGRINGQGTLFNKNGSIIYDGQWKNEKYHGKGVLYNHNKTTCFNETSQVLKLRTKGERTWARYEGNFQDGMWEGSGDLSFTNGDRYIGDFKKDKVEGRGVFVGISGKIVEGAWKDHCLIEPFY